MTLLPPFFNDVVHDVVTRSTNNDVDNVARDVNYFAMKRVVNDDLQDVICDAINDVGADIVFDMVHDVVNDVVNDGVK